MPGFDFLTIWRGDTHLQSSGGQCQVPSCDRILYEHADQRQVMEAKTCIGKDTELVYCFGTNKGWGRQSLRRMENREGRAFFVYAVKVTTAMSLTSSAE